MNPKLTCSQRQWLHISVGRASHRYREVTGSSPVEVLNFFQASLRNCKNFDHNCEYHSSFDIFLVFTVGVHDPHMSLDVAVDFGVVVHPVGVGQSLPSPTFLHPFQLVVSIFPGDVVPRVAHGDQAVQRDLTFLSRVQNNWGVEVNPALVILESKEATPFRSFTEVFPALIGPKAT